jgi:hypothetical protein
MRPSNYSGIFLQPYQELTIMSQFDPAAFLDAVTTAASSTQALPVPVGEYTAIVKDVKGRTWQSKDGSASGLALDIVYEIDDENVKKLLERPTVTVRQSIMLDTTEQGTLDNGKGKNVQLGRLREAVGQNVPGQPWAPRMLVGQPLRVAVSHEMYNDAPVAKVTGTLKLA